MFAVSAVSLTGSPPDGVFVVQPDVAGHETEDPYRTGARDEDAVELVVLHRRRPFAIRMAGLAATAVLVAVRLDVTILVRIIIAGLGLALLAWGLVPRLSRFHLTASRDGLTAGAEGVPRRRCLHFEAEQVHGVFARALERTEDSADRRFELVVIDAAGNLHTLLDGLEGAERMIWIATRLERALGFEPD